MFAIQYLIILLIVRVCDLFVLLDVPTKADKSSNSYYTLVNSSSSSLIDYMRTLYEQEKRNEIKSDYNLIRALAPRIGKISFMSLMCVILD
jgi:hypothetical protein